MASGTYDWAAAIAAVEQFVIDDTAKHSEQLAANITIAQKGWAKLQPLWNACHDERVAANAKVKATTVANFQDWAVAKAKADGARWKLSSEAVSAVAVMRFHTTERRGVFAKWCIDAPRRNENIETYRTWLPKADRGDFTANGKDSPKKSLRDAKRTAKRTTKMATLVEVDGSDITFGRVVVGQKYKFGLTTLQLLRHNLDVTIAQIAAKLSEAEAKEARDAAEAIITKTVNA